MRLPSQRWASYFCQWRLLCHQIKLLFLCSKLNNKLECMEMISLYNLVTFRTFLHHHIKLVIVQVRKEKRFLLTYKSRNKYYIYFNFEQFPLVPANCICRFESSKEMHIVCKKLIWTLNIIFVQVYPCDKHLQSQKLEWKCFVHFSVKEFL